MNMKKLTCEELLDYGFKEFRVNKQFDTCDRVFGYWVKDSVGKKLNVAVRFWQLSKYSTENNVVPDGFDATSQFTCDERRDTMNIVLLHADSKCPQDIILWFNCVFDKLGCDYYEKYLD